MGDMKRNWGRAEKCFCSCVRASTQTVIQAIKPRIGIVKLSIIHTCRYIFVFYGFSFVLCLPNTLLSLASLSDIDVVVLLHVDG
jgi:hypothetical protein